MKEILKKEGGVVHIDKLRAPERLSNLVSAQRTLISFYARSFGGIKEELPACYQKLDSAIEECIEAEAKAIICENPESEAELIVNRLREKLEEEMERGRRNR